MKEAVLALGGNIGDRELNIAEAITQIEGMPATEIKKLSNIYETEPFDVLSVQEKYLNCCVLISTNFTPKQLLAQCQKIENNLHRVREEYHGPRTIDIDILLYDGFSSVTDELTVPHPRIRERAFVMVPLADIFPSYEALGFEFKSDFDKVDKGGIKLYK